MTLLGRRSRDLSVQEVMSTDVITVSPHDTVDNCMELMVTRRIRHLPVIDGGILVAARAKGLGVDVAAPVAPQVPAAAVDAEMDGAAVAEHDGMFFPADLAEFFAVRDDHGERFPSCVKFSSIIYMMKLK